MLHVWQNVPEFFNFAQDVVEKWASSRPDALARWWIDETESAQRRFTFREIADAGIRAANFFASQGIARGDRVIVILPRVPEWWFAVLGLIRMGAVPIPGTPLLTAKDIAYRVEASSAAAIITDAVGASRAGNFTGRKIIVGSDCDGWTRFEAGFATASQQRAAEPTRADDDALIYFTSGTTGDAKMVLHSHASYGMGHEITGRHWLDLHEGDMLWALADTGWAKTAWSNFFGPWICGACVFCVDMRGKFDASFILRTLAKYPIDVFCAPATALRLMVRKDLSSYSFPKLRHCVSAGEALNPPVMEIWKNATGMTIYEAYGQTETVCMIGNFKDRGDVVRPGSMGKPSPGYDIAIIDEDGEELPNGQVGQIAIRVKPHRPLALFKEYWRNPSENAERFVGDWYITGDTGYRDDDGYFWFVGRADDVINSSSYRIGPSEVESALIEHPAVLESAAVGVPDVMRGEVVRAYVVLRPGFEASDHLKHELQAHCKRITAPYKYPRQIVFIADLPKTISGKIRRVELRQKASAEVKQKQAMRASRLARRKDLRVKKIKYRLWMRFFRRLTVAR
jgi:acetyl-CoA synthetase/medium-chain acyl-CoA synthetase